MGRRGRTTSFTAALTLLLLTACSGPDVGGSDSPGGRSRTGQDSGSSDAPVEIFVAPSGDCEPSASGLEPGAAVCDLGSAHQVLTRLRTDDQALGDITVRFAPGLYDMGSYYWPTWAEPGHTLRFVPQWWEPGLDEPTGPLPEFQGDGSSADHWLTLVRHKESPVGAVEIAHLQVTGYANGIMVNGGLVLGSVDGRAEGIEPPAPLVTVDHLVMQDVGNRSDSSSVRGESALGLRNVGSGSVTNSQFEDVANAEDDEEYAHAIYAMDSKAVTINDNVFTRISGDPIRLRNNNQDFVVTDNVFERSGSRAAISDWYVDREAAEERDLPWETHSEKPSVADNDLVGGNYHGDDVVLWRPQNRDADDGHDEDEEQGDDGDD